MGVWKRYDEDRLQKHSEKFINQASYWLKKSTSIFIDSKRFCILAWTPDKETK